MTYIYFSCVRGRKGRIVGKAGQVMHIVLNGDTLVPPANVRLLPLEKIQLQPNANVITSII